MPDDTHLDAAPSAQSPSQRTWFKVLAIAIPSLLGLSGMVALLIHQERLVISGNPFAIRLQEPPIYVEEPDHEISGQRYLFDPVLGWRNVPNYRANTFGHPMSINSRGLRDREYPYEKPSNTKRILVLGDSFTWGYGVGDQDIFTEDLERRLAEADGDWEVINAGVSGWGTDQEYLFLKTEGLKYSPDIVILAFYLRNDPINNTGDVQYGLGKPCFTKGHTGEFTPPVLKPGVDYRQVQGLDPLKTTVPLILGIEELCRKNHARMILMTFGAFGEPDPKNLEAVRWMARSLHYELRMAMTETDLEVVDVDAAFAARNITTESVWEGNRDRHWNAYGHSLVGEILHSYLSAER